MDTKTMIREVKNVAEKHKNNRKFTGQAVITDMCNDIIPKLEKLAEYKAAEEEERLVVLPCKVGDTVYVIEERYYNYQWHTGVQKGCVYGFEYDKAWLIWVSLEDDSASSMNAYKFKNFGKTLFLNREEAEKALKEMEEKYE